MYVKCKYIVLLHICDRSCSCVAPAWNNASKLSQNESKPFGALGTFSHSTSIALLFTQSPPSAADAAVTVLDTVVVALDLQQGRDERDVIPERRISDE